MAIKVSQQELVRKAFLKDLYEIDRRASNGFDYDHNKANIIAMQILPTWYLGIVGRLKSGFYWITRKIVILKFFQNYIDILRAASIIHSAIAHVDPKELEIYQDRNSSGVRSTASFAFEAAARGKKRGKLL